jgi:hypothetical protein
LWKTLNKPSKKVYNVGGLKVPSQINIQKEIDHDVLQGMFT